ncbi:antirestriction protein [uncultured phage_Deep1-GF2-KM23-C739]|uniref:Antirestriction protein n=1 Tax=uncultured phage_Deep1-GF2-KM23-C739 TaxID=2740798 RepID=A0A1B1IVX9_9CAUD|nr:anti-restriction protein [uncultured phage_Deep1-GF2-KM23-C739]ANS05472.1 antirestriction protein [uncultured phage_Deep1-GF2-KM23-C739]
MEEVKQDSQIYVACLASYNAGRLHGSWITPADTEEKLQAQIDKILKSSKEPFAEEWAIHDYDNFPNLGEYPSNENIIKVKKAQKEHGINPINAFLEHYTTDDLEHFTDSYSGEYDSFRDYSDQLFDELYLHDVPKHIIPYIDYGAFENDTKLDTTEVKAPNYKVYIFRQF